MEDTLSEVRNSLRRNVATRAEVAPRLSKALNCRREAGHGFKSPAAERMPVVRRATTERVPVRRGFGSIFGIVFNASEASSSPGLDDSIIASYNLHVSPYLRPPQFAGQSGVRSATRDSYRLARLIAIFSLLTLRKRHCGTPRDRNGIAAAIARRGSRGIE